LILPVALAAGAWAAWAGFGWTRVTAPAAQTFDLPVTTVKRGDVHFTVSARGNLQGSNSEMLLAPMTGARELTLTELRRAGELVEAGDVIARFDTTDQEYALSEAEADVAEADQQVAQAEAESAAKQEETRAAHEQARSDLKLAELEARKNPLVGAIVARQNTLAVEAARDRLRQLERDLGNRRATSQASILIQKAARNKADVKATQARKNIEAMTLKAKTGGYVNIQPNSNLNFAYWGMTLPVFKVGDTARAGMAVAQIPDLHSWDVRAQVTELDRGHLAAGQSASIGVVALPGREFHGHIKTMGSASEGFSWERRFECVFSLDNPPPELRPGMNARVVVTTEVLARVLWIPSQALFESDGKTFVYLRAGSSFTQTDVKLVRRGESQVVVEGLHEGQIVAMASPDPSGKKKSGATGAMKALQGS
jgi:multidrug efflux pump subunit AcrA (membrane-fusion protein)